MKQISVIIPSATVVPKELQFLGEIPAVIYPINSRICFDYLFDAFKDFSDEIKVICFEKESIVKARLKEYDPNIVKIETLSELRDLGYTVYHALENVSSPVIINFADTIILDNMEDAISEDAFFYSWDYASEKWTFYDLNNGEITSVTDKTTGRFGEKRKLFTGVFSIQNQAFFRDCLKKALEISDAEISSFYRALVDYSQRYTFKEIEASSWFDIGHIEKYNDSLIAVKAREFNHITVDKNRGILKKTSENKEKFIGEIRWFLKIPSQIEYLRPRIFSYSTEYDFPFISMEYYDYHTIHELFVYGDLSYNQWKDVFSRILFVLKDLQKYSVVGENLVASLESMYLTKTVKRVNTLYEDNKFKAFFENNIRVNGIDYLPLNRIIEKLNFYIPEMLYDVNKFCIIHGDLCFSNIMIDSKYSFIKLIDPRGEFGEYDIYGDVRYELAKLFHSVEGKYDYIIKDLFKVSYSTKNPYIDFNISYSEDGFSLYDLFVEIFSDEIGDELIKIRFIESLLFLSMIPLHKENICHQMVMLGTGIEILDSVIPIRSGGNNV